MTVERRAERRLVTCLFLDVVGSTDMTVRLGPERVKHDLDRAFADLRAILLTHGGTIEKYIGDAIFVLFGAPIAHADDAERALRAALACAESATVSQRDAGGGVRVRVGIETGEALIDLDAVDVHQQMAVGTVVNLAARLQAHADIGEILVGPTCREAMAEVAQFDHEREIDLKGLGPVAVASLAHMRAHASHRPLRFVGRAPELQMLANAFTRVAGGHATFVLVSGPPGQGKSRLAEEFLAHVGPLTRILAARCRPGTESGALTPLRQLLAADAGQSTNEALAERSAELFSDQTTRDRVTEALAHSSGLATSARLLALPALQRRDELHDAWRRYAGAIALDGPVVLWVEDLHWAEPQLVGILDRLASRSEARVLVLGTARPEFVGSAALRPGDDVIHIELGPLAPEDALELARDVSVLPMRAVERAEGNPLFIVELARARQIGLDLPLTVNAAIATRLDELPPADRQLIQHAAVVGETFGVRDAALLSERDPAEAAGTLARLAHGRYLSTVDGKYRFHHALVRDVAYGRLPVAERMRLHARYAREGVHPDDAEALAHHWWQALGPQDAAWVWEGSADLDEMRREALEAHLDAGKRHADRLSHERAIELYIRALALASDPQDVGRAEAGLGAAYALNAQGDEAWDHRLRAIGAYRTAGIDPPGALYADMLAVPVMNFGYFLKRPRPEDVETLLEEGQRVAASSGDRASLMRLTADRAVFSGDAGIAAEVIRMVDAAPEGTQIGEVLRAIATAQFLAGELEDAEETYRRIDRLRDRGGFVNVGEVLLWRCLQRVAAGDLTAAERLADDLDGFARTSSAHTKGHALGVRALILAARGDWAPLHRIAGEVEDLIKANPTLPFCLVPANATGFSAAADALAGRPCPPELESLMERMMPGVPSQAAGIQVVAYAMYAKPAFGPDLEESYAAKLWWSRNVCDPLGFNPTIASVVAGRWRELAPMQARLERAAVRGSRVAGGLAVAVREEIEHSRGGPLPAHAELNALGYAGMSELLRFRPT